MKSEKRQRTRQVGVRLTPAEFAAITALAAEYHTTLPALLRDAALGVSVRLAAQGSGENNDATPSATSTPRLTEHSPDMTREAG